MLPSCKRVTRDKTTGHGTHVGGMDEGTEKIKRASKVKRGERDQEGLGRHLRAAIHREQETEICRALVIVGGNRRSKELGVTEVAER